MRISNAFFHFQKLSTNSSVDSFEIYNYAKSYPQFIHNCRKTAFHAKFFDKHLFFMQKVIHIYNIIRNIYMRRCGQVEVHKLSKYIQFNIF